jgi:hypothetical protein
MTGGVLIDSKGRALPDNSWDLATRIGYKDPRLDIAGYAVRERGFIHIVPRERGLRVTVRERRFGLVTFAGAMLELRRRQPAQIVLCVIGDSAPGYRIFNDLHDFCAEVEPLAESKLEVRLPRLCEQRATKVLHLAPFAVARPLIQLWEKTHGEFTDEARRVVVSGDLFRRTVVVRKTADSSRLITEHVGCGIKTIRPCEALCNVGRDFAEHHSDRAYGAWVSESYDRALWSRRIQVESIRALLNTDAAERLWRYDRVLIPWRSPRNTDWFATALSISREAPAAAS